VQEFPDVSDDEDELVKEKLNRSNEDKSSDYESVKDDYPGKSHGKSSLLIHPIGSV